MRNVSNSVEKIKTHILRSITFSEKSCRLYNNNNNNNNNNIYLLQLSCYPVAVVIYPVAVVYEIVCFFYPLPHMSFTDFVVFPPGHGRSVTDF